MRQGNGPCQRCSEQGKDNEPQTKIRRKRIITKFNRDRENEEDLPGDELIIKTIKQEPNQYIKQIIIKKDGKVQEIEEELPEKEIVSEKPKEIISGKQKEIISEKPKEIISDKPKEVVSEPKINRRAYIRKDIEDNKVEEKPEDASKTIKIGQERAPQIIHKKIIPKTIKEQEQKEEIIGTPKKEEKPEVQESKIVRRKIIPKDYSKSKEKEEPEQEIPLEEIIYKIVTTGRYRYRRTKVIKKTKDKEEDKLDDEIIYETGENKPNIKVIRKSFDKI